MLSAAQIATCCFAREIYLYAFNLNAKDLCIASLLNKVLQGSAEKCFCELLPSVRHSAMKQMLSWRFRKNFWDVCSQTIACDGRLNPKLFVMLASIEYNMLGKIMKKTRLQQHWSGSFIPDIFSKRQRNSYCRTTKKPRLKTCIWSTKVERWGIMWHVFLSLNCLMINLKQKKKWSKQPNLCLSVCPSTRNNVCVKVKGIFEWKGCKKPV